MRVGSITMATALLAAAVLLSASPANAQSVFGGPPTKARSLAQDLLNRYGGSADPNSVQAANSALSNPAGVDLSNFSGIDRAQAFLDQNAPGQLDLRRDDLGLGDAVRNLGPAQTGRSSLHKSAANEAGKAFKAQDFRRAARWITAVTGDLPGDGELRQFESLVWLGMNDSQRAELALLEGLKAADAWQVDRLEQFFDNSEQYAQLYQNMANSAAERSESPSFWLLVAYHERLLGRSEQCLSALEKLVATNGDGVVPVAVVNKVRPHSTNPVSLID